jgi:hypothetical protein
MRISHVFLAGGITILALGCKQPMKSVYYFESIAVQKKLPAKSSVGVILFERDGITRARRTGSMMASVAIAYLYEKGEHPVMVLDAREVGGVVLTESKHFSAKFRPDVRRGEAPKSVVSAPKKDEGESPGEEMPGEEEPGGLVPPPKEEKRVKRTRAINEFTEGTARVEEGLDLIEAYLKDWNLDYVLALWSPMPYSYRAQLIELESRNIIADITMNGTHYGWFSHNSFTRFERDRLGPRGLRYENLTSYDKALLVFLYRAIESVTGGTAAGGGKDSSEIPDGW